MNDRLKGKVALITGAAGGLGHGLVRRMGESGAKLVLTDIDRAEGEAALEISRTAGVEAIFLEHDVADEASWAEVIGAAVAHFGKIDIAVNNAGVGSSAPRGIEDVSLEEWRRVMRVNLDGVFLGCRTQIAAMKETGGGSIINIGSTAGYVGTRGGPAYGTSKGALRTLTKHCATSCARLGYGIRVNCLHPSYVWTPLAARLATGTPEEAKAKLREIHPFGGLGEPDDVAWAVVYLGSDEARFVTGSDLIIDGGFLSV
ncbi:NAD(P)-dependent dehydrogenase (short-subunit alcohol dehydrogenase family) [Rhodoligotrophos appendicifer]|uniref:glucose 1-dehydrogenase n=1 Tax=Rhodoligotrophos appendicifer TaxID=987056 RepID=UPI001184CF10|nr:glucose 1-dehydrogenase [Rhodoligotrophos appendicifer]